MRTWCMSCMLGSSDHGVPHCEHELIFQQFKYQQHAKVQAPLLWQISSRHGDPCREANNTFPIWLYSASFYWGFVFICHFFIGCLITVLFLTCLVVFKPFYPSGVAVNEFLSRLTWCEQICSKAEKICCISHLQFCPGLKWEHKRSFLCWLNSHDSGAHHPARVQWQSTFERMLCKQNKTLFSPLLKDYHNIICSEIKFYFTSPCRLIGVATIFKHSEPLGKVSNIKIYQMVFSMGSFPSHISWSKSPNLWKQKVQWKNGDIKVCH